MYVIDKHKQTDTHICISIIVCNFRRTLLLPYIYNILSSIFGENNKSRGIFFIKLPPYGMTIFPAYTFPHLHPPHEKLSLWYSCLAQLQSLEILFFLVRQMYAFSYHHS